MSPGIIDRREFIRFAGAGIGAVMCTSPATALAKANPRKPNLLFIFADQMRFSAMGCMGNGFIRTPNLDNLAKEGILFTNAFSSSPVCTPYRGQLMTGKYGTKTGVIHNGDRLAAEQTCIAEIFKDAGYATGYIGKWHLRGNPEKLGETPKQSDIEALHFVPPGPARQGWVYWAASECLHIYHNPVYYHNNKKPIRVEGYEPEIQTDLAIEYMQRHRDHPFCLMLSWGPPHPPYAPPERYAIYDPEKVPLRPNVPRKKEKAAQETIAAYYGLVTSLDDNIARISKALDDLGLSENTIVCFTSDHGDMLYSQGQQHKQRPWEESIHIPFILRYPAKVKSGRKEDVLFNSVDVMPTLLGLCGLPIPTDVQGTDLSPLIFSRDFKQPDSSYFANDSWWIGGPGYDWRGVRTKEWMFVRTRKEDRLLYNVKHDPYQLKNLARNPKYNEKKKELRKTLYGWIEEVGDSFKEKA